MLGRKLTTWKVCRSFSKPHVPTPFYHLSIARHIYEHPVLDPGLRIFLLQNLGAFLLGNTAPDVQVISGQKRSTTHFFTVPIPLNGQVPWIQLFIEHPPESQPGKFQLSRAAFIAGYLCHLQADWLWVQDIFEPVFGPHQSWETFSKRLYLHNVLRSYLDEQVIASLPTSVVAALRRTSPQRWLPFLQDEFLVEWRDYLADQLQSGEGVRTIEVFAARHGIDPAAFQTMISSEERMESNVFAHISRQQLDDYRTDLLNQNIELLTDYLGDFSRPSKRLSNSMNNYDRSGI
jgi:hypothetical protein